MNVKNNQKSVIEVLKIKKNNKEESEIAMFDFLTSMCGNIII